VKDFDKKIAELISKTKGQYITQGVAFNKDCPRQMELLRFALTDSVSFSGLVKELLALKMNGSPIESRPSSLTSSTIQSTIEPPAPAVKDFGNFL
jgi:hypothetical protein